MKTLDYQVCSKFHCWQRKIRELEMSTMSLINDQRNLMLVRNLGDFLNIRNHSVISRRSDQYCLDIFIFSRHLSTCPEVNPAIYSQFCPSVDKYKLVQDLLDKSHDRLLYDSYAPPGSVLPFPRNCCRNSCKQSCSTSIHTVITLFYSIKLWTVFCASRRISSG